MHRVSVFADCWEEARKKLVRSNNDLRTIFFFFIVFKHVFCFDCDTLALADVEEMELLCDSK